jgi:hypothetical protein
MNSIIPFTAGVLATCLVRNISKYQVVLSYSYVMEDKFTMTTTMRNYKNVTLVNKESLENRGYAIDMKNSSGWFFDNYTEITISKNKPADYVEEYDLLEKALHESDFHVTYVNVKDDKVEVEYLNGKHKKSK